MNKFFKNSSFCQTSSFRTKYLCLNFYEQVNTVKVNFYSRTRIRSMSGLRSRSLCLEIIFLGWFRGWLKILFKSKLIENRYGRPNVNSTGEHISNTGKYRINSTRNPICRNLKVKSTGNPKGNNTVHPNLNNTRNSRPVFYT